MTAPILHAGDCIHIALPVGSNPRALSASIAAAYEQIGVRVFMIDHVVGLIAPVIVGVVRDVPPEFVFRPDSAQEMQR